MVQLLNRWLLGGWVVLSPLLQLGSIASLVDGIAQWYGTLGDIVWLYRTLVRNTVLWLFSLLSLRVSGWVADLFVLWSVFFLTVNIAGAWCQGRIMLGYLRDRYGLMGVIAALPFYYFILPFYVMRQLFSQDERNRHVACEVLANIATLIFLMLIMLFTNQQLKKGGFV